MTDKLDLQNIEFDRMTKLAEAWTILRKIAVVEDDYPQYRRKYEAAMRDFIDAIRANGRI